MKKLMVVILALLTIPLYGCSGNETYEVLGDSLTEELVAEPAQIQLSLPQDDTLIVTQGDGWKIYTGENYEIFVQTYPSGNLQNTLQLVTGYKKGNLSVIALTDGDLDRYLCAWSAVSEEGELVGRCAVLDDGKYHYCLTALINAETSNQIRPAVDAIFASYTLESY